MQLLLLLQIECPTDKYCYQIKPKIKNSFIKNGDEKERSSLSANIIASVKLPKNTNQNNGINNAKIKVADEEIRIIMGLFYYTISSFG